MSERTSEDSTPHPALRDLVADCLSRMEREGDRALEELCAEHPEQADALRARVARLKSLGLGGEETTLEARIPEVLGEFRLLEKIGKKPLLDFGMRLGEASGAALCIPILKAAAICHSGMATFAEAQVAGRL